MGAFLVVDNKTDWLNEYMITNAILNLLYWIIRIFAFPILFLSDVVLPTEIATALADAGDAFNIISTVLPIGTFITISGLFIVVETAILLWGGLNWLIRKIPFIN